MIGIFVSLILLALAVLVYQKDLRAKNFGWLFIFRILVVIFLSLMLIGNIIAFTFYQSPKIPLLVLTDVSPSMSQQLTQAKQFLTNFKQATKYKTQFLFFADSILSTKNDTFEIQGTKTDIAKTLIMAKQKKPGAVILLSDGRNNAISDPVQIASELPFFIYTVGFGKTSERDMAIRTLNAPKQIYLGETTLVTIRIASQGLGNKKAKVSLIQGTKELEKQEVTLSDILTEQELTFHIVPTEIGRMIFKIKITSPEPEDNVANNEKEFSLTVLKSRLKIYILSNSPNYNTRFILSALKSEMVDVLPILAFQGNRFQIPSDQGMRDFRFRLDCDVLIVDDFDATGLPNETNNQIIQFVENGGGLLLLWGEKSRLNQAWSDILPFIPNQRITRKEVFVKLTDAGLTVPIFFDGGENLLENTPPLSGIAEVKESQKETKVWATADPLGSPLIGYRKSGKGKVIEVTGFPIWRWGFYGTDLENSQKKFRKFLIQTARFLALKDFERFTLDTDQPVYQTGEKVTFTFQAYQEDGRPWDGLDVNLIIGQEEIPMIEVTSGIYEKTIEALSPKDYTVKAVAKLDTLQVGQAKTDFRVSETNIEMVETGLNSDLLKRIAQASGGEYYDAASFPINNFEITLAKYHTTFRFDTRRSVYLYVILAGLFLIELYFRKRRGLM